MISFASVGPGDGFDHWHQVTCRNYSLTECRAIPDKDFHATVEVQAFGGLIFSNISSHVQGGAALAVQRRMADIRRDGREEFYFWVGRAGSTLLEQQGRVATLGPGDIALLDQARPFNLAFGDVSAATMIIVDRSSLTARLPWAEQAVVSRMPAQASWSRLFVSLLDNCLEGAGQQPMPDMQRLSAHALDMWSSVAELALRGDADIAMRHGRKLQQVQAYLRAHLEDTELETAAIAKAMNMSPRTLGRLFAAIGTTPMRWLLEERLQASHEALCRHRFTRVTDAAFAYGFCNLSHFSRAFKARFGMSPQQLLRRH